jgi:hypothetical protein
LEINAKTKARVIEVMGRYNDAKGDKRQGVDVAIGCGPKACEDYFGKELADVLFSAYVDGTWRLKDPQPSKHVDCVNHAIDLDGNRYVCKPKIKKFIPVDDTEKIVAIIRLKLGKAQGNIVRDMFTKLGTDIDLRIEPSEQDLPLDDDGTTNLSDRQMEVFPREAHA